MSLRERYLALHGNDAVAASTEMAEALMLGDPACFKAGYTADNAAIAVRDLFGLSADDTAKVCAAVGADAALVARIAGRSFA